MLIKSSTAIIILRQGDQIQMEDIPSETSLDAVNDELDYM